MSPVVSISAPTAALSMPSTKSSSKCPSSCDITKGIKSRLSVDESHDDTEKLGPTDGQERTTTCDATADTLDCSSSTWKSSLSSITSCTLEKRQPPESSGGRPTMSRRRSSLKLTDSFSENDLFVESKKKSWKCLPAPDLKKIVTGAKNVRSSSVGTVDTVATMEERSAVMTLNDKKKKNGVAFGNITIREYDLTLGDNPSVSYGPPISLDWNYEEHTPLDLDDYEINRQPRRKLRQMMMNYYQRKNVLMHTYGHSEQELKTAQREAAKVQQQRSVTKVSMKFFKLQDAIESTSRKTKRIVGGGKQKRKQ